VTSPPDADPASLREYCPVCAGPLNSTQMCWFVKGKILCSETCAWKAAHSR